MTVPLRLLACTDAAGLGGAEVCLGYLLAALDPSIEVAVVGPDRAIVERIARDRPGTALATVGAADVRGHLRAILAFRPDVVHVNRGHLWAGEAATVAAGLAPGVRAVAVEHLPHRFAVGRRTVWRRLAVNRLLDAHVSVGVRAAALVEQILGAPAGRVTAIANGVPAGGVGADPVAGAADGAVVLGSVGRLSEQKGLDALVRALADVPSARAVLVGDGPERPALESLADRLGVADRLVVTGWTDAPSRWYGTFDVLVVPSHYEGLPLAILEAMHAGLPVVATDVGSVAEAVRDGETGVVVGTGDQRALTAALARLAGDPQERRRLGDAGRALAASTFTAAAMARQYEALYRRLSARSSSGRTTPSAASSTA